MARSETAPERARERIAAVPVPPQDPITGANGALVELDGSGPAPGGE